MERRSFLNWAIHGLGALFAVILGFPALAYLIDPLHRSAPQSKRKRVARLSELEIDKPKQVAIRDIRRDAWTLQPSDVIGRVWLLRRPGDKVDAFTTICTHLGCSINFEPSTRRFVCPCHGGTFHLSGDRVADAELGKANPAPRGMDVLESRLVKDPGSDDFFIEVKYENFIQGREEKVPKA